MSGSSPDRSTIGVAIVDDDRDYAEALAELLSLGPWFQVVGIATSVSAGIELLASGEVQLGLVDVHMPDGGGVHVVETVRQWTKQPVLVLISAHSPNSAALAAGVNLIPKDLIDELQLVEIVRGPPPDDARP